MSILKCPLCFSIDSKSFYISTQEQNKKKRVIAFKCKNCGLVYLKHYKSDLSYLYDENYSVFSKSEEKYEDIISKSKKESFKLQIKLLMKYIKPKDKKFLDIGTNKGYLLEVAQELGFNCYGLDVSNYAVSFAKKKFPNTIFNGTLAQAKYEDATFDVIALTDLIEHISDINSLFKEITRVLKPGGLIFIITPQVDSLTCKILKKNWFQYKFEHVIYFNRKSINFLFEKFGLKILKFQGNKKKFSLAYYNIYFNKYSLFGIDLIFNTFYKRLPGFLKNFYFINPITGELITVAKKL